MKPNPFVTTASALFLALTAHAQAAVSLGTAANFRVLAGSTITNTGPTVVNGSIGVHDGTAISGFYGTVENDGPGIFTGTAHQGDGVAEQAQIDANAAFTNLNNLAVTAVTTGDDLGGQTLGPGVYELGSASMSTILTLNGSGDYVFQINSTLITSDFSSIILIGGAEAANIYWAVGSSATLATGTDFVGNIIASDSITFVTGASLDGRAIALTAAVTMDTNSIIPEPSTMALLGVLSMGLILRRRRAFH